MNMTIVLISLLAIIILLSSIRLCPAQRGPAIKYKNAEYDLLKESFTTSVDNIVAGQRGKLVKELTEQKRQDLKINSLKKMIKDFENEVSEQLKILHNTT